MRHSSIMRKKIPLEEALASVDFPVYGLPEEVLGLCYTDYTYFPNIARRHQFTLNYQSERYAPFRHEKVRGPTFSVSSFMNSCDWGDVKPEWYSAWWNPNDIPLQDQRFLFVCNCSFSIDGTPLTGRITYRPAPLYHSTFWLYGQRLRLDGQALGPDPDDLIQILESLRVLNRKQGVKSSSQF